MGRKRKRGQAATQRWGSTSSRKQKKKRKTRGQGFKQANVPKEVDSLHIKPSNSTNCKMSITREKSESSCSEIPSCFMDGSLQRAKFWGINAIFSRLKTLASFCQHSAIECFMSIRSVFLLLSWLKQTFGYGFQTLGKVS